MENSHDKSFFSTFAVVMGGLFALFFGIIILADFIGGGTDADPKLIARQVQDNTAPVAKVITDPSLLVKASPAGPAHAALSGEDVVAQTCSACHGTGVLGAPKIGDKADWGKRKSEAGGLDGLLKFAISGKNQMPPRGGNPDLSDAEIKSAIEYMLKKAGL